MLMFRSARLKLTVFYLAILVWICLLFSMLVYRSATDELQRSLHTQTMRYFAMQRLRIDVPLQDTPSTFSVPLPSSIETVEENIFSQGKQRIAVGLLIIDVAILFLAGAASYFLAGKTLKPIEEMLDEQKRFIADASHELRTPLTALKTEIEVTLRDKNLTLLDAKHLLSSNLEEVEKLEHLSQHLLQLEKYHKEELSPPQKMSVEEVFEAAKKKIFPQLQKKRITLRAEHLEGVVMGQPTSIIELITILLDNAIKYSPAKTTIEIQTICIKKNVKLAVHDQGYGIAPQDLPYIFNRFYRASTSRQKENENGYGLGLSIAKRIAQANNASISVESALGKGSCFTVTFPRVR
ncbi:hypothetical protein C5B42_04745 [Candidatus Cerribacteria bacterium 'Amazon FNV 2010 28 9']|uniref:histidine kinase n=1 Tax=Candidatus Cerribacteria bacterium 'Amazon FNV 2010 28 9' TaxID=2081795 RepID=A0A317JPC9_9BACT|nr:MAG: hypothetical protein C5B42_04745 [Candidatus Cerribacteria bacterium 'Amazon FNV 2010 28 9']